MSDHYVRKTRDISLRISSKNGFYRSRKKYPYNSYLQTHTNGISEQWSIGVPLPRQRYSYGNASRILHVDPHQVETYW